MFNKLGFLQEDSDSPAESMNYYREALLLPHNWITLAAVAALSLLVLSPFPLLAAMGLEMMYLSTVPTNPRFQRWVRAHRQVLQRRQNERKLAEMVKALPVNLRKQCWGLERICQTIRANYDELSSPSKMFLEQLQQTLGGLLHTYVRLLFGAHQQRRYLQDANPEAIRRELGQLQATLGEDQSEVQAINRQRFEILNERLEKAEKIQENAGILEAQCAAISDVLRLICEQSMSLRDPQHISEELQNLLDEVRNTEETVREVETIFQAESGLMSPLLSPLARTTASGSRQGGL